MLKFLMVMTLTLIMKKLNLPAVVALLIFTFASSLQKTVASKITYNMCSDLISFWITSMSMMVIFTLILINQKKNNVHQKVMMMMILAITATFHSWNFVAFYMLFEMSMILILMIIISWGYQPERTEAMMFMIIMTFMFSLPFFTSMMINNKTMNYWFMEINYHLMTFLSFMFIFMMKMPIYFMHFWLPKVHVEAPVQGSMILAAVMLKLGCYGMIRMKEVMVKFGKVKLTLMSMSIYSMMILSMTCIMQTDMKTLIAYSSIVHMTLVFMNIMIMKIKSLFSSMVIILGHGLSAATMFFMANMMYESSKSRSVMLNKGILNMMPAMSLMWFSACMNNAPMPPSMNMMGELMSFKNIVTWSKSLYPVITMVALMSSMYSIYLFYIPMHSKFSKLVNKMETHTTKNSMIVTTIMLPLVLIMVKPSMLSM